MSNDPSGTDSAFGIISIAGPDDMAAFTAAAVKFGQFCEGRLTRARYRVARDALPIIRDHVSKRGAPAFAMRSADALTGDDIADVWISQESAEPRSAISDSALISIILEYATDAGYTIHHNTPDDSNDVLSIFRNNPRCLLVIMCPPGLASHIHVRGRPAPTRLGATDPIRPFLDNRPRSAAPAAASPEREDQADRFLSLRRERRLEADSNDNAMMVDRLMVAGSAYSAGRDQLLYGMPASAGGYGQPPDVPKQIRDEPLPHDGLFIRRNNAFGTKSTLGITDLIDQGVLIDQTQIRFDDFIASRTDGIPLPQAGEAVAVSHGCAAAPSVAKASPGTTHFLELALRAAQEPGDDAPHGEPLPVNFVFVVDTSSSMAGSKIEIVKESLRQLYDQLRDTDVLGVVTFDTNVRTVLQATRKADLPADQLMNVVYGLRASGGTDLNLGLLYGIDEISRHAEDRPDLVNCLYLFSDGDPTSGERDWIKIRSNVAGRLRGDLTISSFGFGSDARIRELEALAGSAGGHFTFVDRPEDVRLNLREDLTRREHLAAINIQLQIEIAPDIKIWHLYGHDLVTDPAVRAAVLRDAAEARRKGQAEFGTQALPDLITQEKGIRIFAPDLAFGETYWIVLELELPGDATLPSLGQATVQYVDTVARENRSHNLTLTTSGVIPEATVVAHAIGLWTSEVTFYALDDLYQQDRATAQKRLTQHAGMLQSLHKILPVQQFLDDQVTVSKLISLSGNLGRPVAWQDSSTGGPWQYAVHTMNAFGQVRAGYDRAHF